MSSVAKGHVGNTGVMACYFGSNPSGLHQVSDVCEGAQKTASH